MKEPVLMVPAIIVLSNRSRKEKLERCMKILGEKSALV
jgi:hypothetical protein